MLRHHALAALALLCLPAVTLGQANPVLTWGTNTFGELGDGTTNGHITALPAFFVSGIKQVAAGGGHTLVLTSDGRVYAWGNNANGQLGVGDKVARSVPTLVPGLANVVAIACGWGHSLALVSSGQVYTWGSNGSGALGLGDSTDRTSPSPTLLTRIKAIAGGGGHSMALSEAGDLFTTGYNFYGQLGVGNNTNSLFWTAVTPMARQVKAIAAGQAHSVLLLTNGRIYCAGDNTFRELADGTTTNRNVFVASSIVSARVIGSGPAAYHSMAVRLDGTVTAWGRNGSGQIGNGTTALGSAPSVMTNVRNAKEVSAGGAHSLILLANGKAMAVGANFGGRLGDGTTTDRLTAVAVKGSALWSAIAAGGGHSVALKCTGVPRTWGRGTEGQLGNGLLVNKTSPVLMSGVSSGVLAVATGIESTYILKADGTVWATGVNRFGQLGNGTTTNAVKPAKIPGLANVIAVASGGFHGIALTADGLMWGWGGNFDGQLGLGDRVNRLSPALINGTCVAVAAGRNHTLVLTYDGKLYACGTNEFGQVGGGYDQKVPQFVPVTWSYAYLPIAISCGSAFNLTISGDGTVSGWGHNGGGQLGVGDFNPHLSPVHEVGTLAMHIATGYTHSFHHNALGELYAAGSNDWGELGTGNTNYHNSWTFMLTGVAAIAAGGVHSAAIDGSGNLWAWGYNADGSVGDGTTVNRLNAKYIATHPYTTSLWVGSDGGQTAAISMRPVMLSSVKLSPTSVVGGTSSTGTVTLTTAAGAGGLVVTLSSNNAKAAVPPSVTVAAGSKTATFTVTTQAVTAVTKPVITGTLVVSKTAVLTINP